MLKYISNSETETKELAAKLVPFLSGGDVLCLFGELGSGKTAFTSGIAKGIGINEPISSPTFTLLNEYYSGNIPLYHFDVYRINSDEFLNIGGDEYFSGRGIVIIEWAENIRDILPAERLEIYINYLDPLTNINKREICFKPLGQKYIDILNKIAEVTK